MHVVRINLYCLRCLCWGGGGGGARVSRGEAAILNLGSGHSPGWMSLFDVDCFNDLLPCVVRLLLLDCSSFPVHLVLCLPCVYCNAILQVVPLHCSSVLTQSLLQCSSSFSDVHAVTVSTRYLVHNPFFLQCCLRLLCVDQGFMESSPRLEGGFDP